MLSVGRGIFSVINTENSAYLSKLQNRATFLATVVKNLTLESNLSP